MDFSTRSDHARALRAAVQALMQEDSALTRATFVACMRWMQFHQDNAVLRGLLMRALCEGWARPEDLAAQICDLVHGAGTDMPRLAQDALLAAFLIRAVNQDPVLENALTAARRQLLIQAAAGTETPLDFQTVLARQCFLNEYVFAVTDDEGSHIAALHAQMRTALDRGAPPSPAHIAALASYAPLTDARLLEQSWPPAIDALLTQQMREPAQERALARALPSLTPIADAVSRKVAAHYEEHPYPRWTMAGPPQPAAHMAQTPRTILIVGCGTGRNAIETARTFPRARVLAVDLSRAALGHAARKAHETGVTNIDYAQADLLEMTGMVRRFDLIEAMGVLHHLADPWAGWRILLSLLTPDGVMKVGLYSATARQGIQTARAELATQGFTPTTDGICAARQYLLARPGFADVTQRPDFFSVSACRDLLFHAQETSLSWGDIADFLHEYRLTVLGLDVEAPILAAYRARFPHDTAATNLDNWAAFEADHPHTFDGMYQFWIGRA